MIKDGYDPTKADAEARSQFQVAKTRLHAIGAVILIQSVAGVLPDATFEVIDDFEKAGGPGMPPKVVLQKPKTLTHGGKDILGREVRTVRVSRRLSVHPLVFNPDLIIINVWESKETEYPDGNKNSFGYGLSHATATSGQQLAQAIWSAMEKFTTIQDGNVAKKVQDVLGLNPLQSKPSKHIAKDKFQKRQH